MDSLERPGYRRHVVRGRVAVGVIVTLLAACGGGSSSTPTPPPSLISSASSSPDRVEFCQHFNVDLLNALNSMSGGSATDIQPSLDALYVAANGFRQDAKSNDPQVRAFAVRVLAGIAQLSDMISNAGTLKVIDQQGLGPRFTDATIAVGSYCS